MTLGSDDFIRVPLPAAMITIFSAMCAPFLSRWFKSLIIGLTTAGCLTLLSGCSTVRLAYDQAPTLTRWWLDGFLDFQDAQDLPLKEGLARWFNWHRRTQLPDYAALLARAQKEVMEPMTGAQMCTWGEEVRLRYERAVDAALPMAAAIAPTLSGEQLTHLEEKYAKRNADYRKKYLKPQTQERLDDALERAVDRAQTLYGKLDPAQKKLLADQMRDNPMDAQGWYAQRLAQQRDILDTLRRLTAEKATSERALLALGELKSRWMSTPRADGNGWDQRMIRINCDAFAALHNTTTAAQRRHARDKLRGWEQDLRVLAARAM